MFLRQEQPTEHTGDRKLAPMGEVDGLVVGAFGEVSAASHALINHMATSRVLVASQQLGRRGQLRNDKAEIAIMTIFLRWTFSICAVKVGGAWGRSRNCFRQEELCCWAGAEVEQTTPSTCTSRTEICSEGGSSIWNDCIYSWSLFLYVTKFYSCFLLFFIYWSLVISYKWFWLATIYSYSCLVLCDTITLK